MNSHFLDILLNLAAAMAAGGLIGLERSYYGRPAGFRTHTLVCLASSLLMLITVYQQDWFPGAKGMVSMDPTRMAQGIMTGIGFLGAGVILKDRLAVRGLTTAASIWITAALGILAGVGFYLALVLAAALALGTLAAFRFLERRIPSLIYMRNSIRFRRENILPEKELRDIIAGHGLGISFISYGLIEGGEFFEYDIVMNTRKTEVISFLARTLERLDSVVEFRINPPGN